MKKIILILISIAFLQYSCTKETIITDKPIKVGDNYSYKLEPLKIIINEEDPIDTKFKKGQLAISEALFFLLQKANLRELIIQEAKKTKYGILPLEVLFKLKPELKNSINKYLKNSEMAQLLNISDYDKFVETMNHSGYKYTLAMNIPNIDKVENNVDFIVSPGIETKDNEKYKILDNIFAWSYNGTNNFEVSISKNFSLNTKTPIFILIPYYQDDTESNIYASNTSNKNNASKTWRARKFKINMKYESGGRSELAAVGVQMHNGSYIGLWGGITGGFGTLLASVPSNKIGKYIYSSKFFGDNDYAGLISYNLYEEDWWAYPYKLSCITGVTCTEGLTGRRTYFHEWYLFHPNSNVYQRALNPNSNATYITKISSKCYFQLKRY